jgi:hypothetical protein
MTAPRSTEFDEFLFAPIGEEADGTPLTVLSVLARLDVDPWDEAAELARLSVESATQKLVSMLTATPSWRVPPEDTSTIATRLVELLHRAPKPKPKVHSPAAPLHIAVATRSKSVPPAIYYLAALIFMVVVQWAMTRQPHTPVDTSLTPATPVR